MRAECDQKRGEGFPPRQVPAARALLLLLLVTTTSMMLLLHPYYDERSDASTYILTCQSILAGDGYAYAGRPFVVRPPGWSVLLIPVVALFGTNFGILNLYTSCFGIVCVVLLFLFAKDRLGSHLAFTVALAVWFNPEFQRMCQQTMSDVPGAALLFACLLADRRVRKEPSWGRDLLLGIVLGAAGYVRTLLLLLGPAIVVSRVARHARTGRRGDRIRHATYSAALLLGVPLLVHVPWMIRNAVQAPVGAVEHLMVHSYRVGMWHTDSGDPNSPELTWRQITHRIPSQSARMVASIGSRMQSDVLRKRHFLIVIVAYGCAVVALVRHREPAEVYIAALTLVVCVYFAYQTRLVLALYLLLFVSVAEVVVLGLGRLVSARASDLVACTLVVLLAAHDFDPGYKRHTIVRRHESRAKVCNDLSREYSDEDALAAFSGQHWSLLLQRPVHSLRHALQREGIERVRAIIADYEISAVVIPESQSAEPLRDWAAENCESHQRFEDWTVYRMSPSVGRSARE